MRKITFTKRKRLVVVEGGLGIYSNKRIVSSICKNIESLGFTFSKELFETLSTLSVEELTEFYQELIPALKDMVGADVRHTPMYPNFPKSVMEADDLELYFNALVHYWSGGKLVPNETKDIRLPLFEETSVKVIGLAGKEIFQEIFENLCSSKTSLSNMDKEDLRWLLENYEVTIPEDIPLKENVAYIGTLLLKSNSPKLDEFKKNIKTATDVLRLATAMSYGDISLAANTRFISFKRNERRGLLELLESVSSLEEDMVRYKNRWIRLGERLHPGDYPQFKRVNKAFYKLRNGVHISTFSSNLEKSILQQDYKTAVEMLKRRPGEFARRLDELLRKSYRKAFIIDAFKEIATEVSTPVLLQVKSHFEERKINDKKFRIFFPKGSIAKAQCVDNTLSVIEEKYCNQIIEICKSALITNYAQKDSLGKVYLSEDYKNYLVPFSQRSASKALKTMVRGSRIPIRTDVNTLRGFIWWTNANHYGRVDLDLSAAIFDADWKYKEHVSYTNLRSETYQAYHSGDITNGGPEDGDGVSEFLDIDIDSVVKYGGRYVVYQVYNYTRQNLSELPHAMFGWMERENCGSGEIYEPKTVAQKMDLTSQSTICIPVIFDCVTREVIWCDMNLSIDYCSANNVENNLRGVSATCYGIVNMCKPNLYDLISLHIAARGEQVENREDADVIFDIDTGITPFNTEVFMGEYL